MFDKLLDFILNFIEDILPFVFIKQYDKGVVYRAGKYHRVAEPGFRWKIPFIESVETKCVVTTTLTIPTQSLTTKDGMSIVVKAVVKYNLSDITKFSLNVYDGFDAISDVTQAIVKQIVMERDWKECLDNDIDNKITTKLRTEVKKWGIVVEKVTLTDLGLIRSIRLFNENGLNG